MFGSSFAVYAVAEFIKLVLMTNDADVWSNCFMETVKSDMDAEMKTIKIQQCNQKVTWFPIFYTVWSFFSMFIFKKGEDYIAKYSQNHSLLIVSIYQRRILDKDGNFDEGITY